MTFFERGYLTKEIPPNFAVAKNSGSAPLKFLESPVNLLDPEFLATGSEPYGYPLEENGHGRKEGFFEPERGHANTFERYQYSTTRYRVLHERSIKIHASFLYEPFSPCA